MNKCDNQPIGGTAKCTKLFARIDELEKEYINFWVEVCKIESPTEYKEGVDRVGRYFMEKAQKRGWKIEVQKQPVSGDCICITMNAESKERPIVFSGHMDTVHPIGYFGEEVVTCDEEKIYGPGVMDCKGGTVACFYAMAALDDCGFKGRPVKLLLQSDEENGSRTSNKTTVKYMCEKSEGCIAFLNTEACTRGKATVTRKGISKYEFEVTGKSVHGSQCYQGISAVREAAYKIIELEKMKNPAGLTCNCGIIHGGTAENTVPNKCIFTADIRFCNNQEKLEADRIVKELAAKSFVEGTTCEVTLKSYRCAMEKTEQNMALLKRINEIYAAEGMRVLEPNHRNGGGDSSDVTEYGLPCLDSFGVDGDREHSRSEFAYLDSLAEAAKNLAAVAYCI